MVKTSLGHIFYWSLRTCRKPASQTDTFFLVDIFSKQSECKILCIWKKNWRGKRSA